MVDKRYNRTILFYLKKNHLEDPGRSAIRSWSQFPGSNIWRQKKQVFKTLFLLIIATVWAAGNQTLQAQTAITDINATYDDITDASDNYTAGGVDYNFNVGSQNNLRIDNVDFSGTLFEPVRFANQINILRVDNPEVSGDKQLMFYEQESASASEINLAPSFLNTMEEVLLNTVINRGSDNIFGNQGDGSGNNNNIERLDFIFDDGIVAPSNTSDEGFVIFERGGNDAFIIAPILTLDGSGNPASYGNVVEVVTTDWGTSSLSIVTEVMSSPSPTDDLQSTTTVSSQNIAGVLISFSDFGLNPGDTIFGYSLAGGDVNYTTPSDLLSVSDGTIFPTNTSSTSGTQGGMDMIAGGSFFSSNLVETSVSLEGGPCWRMLSSPVATTYANLLNGLWTQGAPGANYTGGNPNVLLWPDVSGEDPADWTAPASLNDPIPAGTGFIISVFDDDDFDGAGDGFPKTLSVSGTGHSGTISPTMNSNTDGWTLVGNPYGEPIDFDLVSKTDLTNVAYVYDRNAGGTTNGNAGGWRSTDGVVGDQFDGIISPLQGFFVQNSGAGPNITFEEADQTTGGTFYGKHKEEDRHVIRMELNGEGLVNSAWLTFSESGNVKQIRGDAWELLPFSEQYATLATRKSGDELLDIAHFPVSEAPVEIPVHVATTSPGSYSLQITDFDLPPDAELILTDHQLGREVPLGENSEYEFNIESPHKENPLSVQCNDHANTFGKLKPSIATAESGDRFSISLMNLEAKTELPKETALDQNYPNPFNPSTLISYQLPATSEVQLEVFDLLGRQVANLVEGTVEAGVHQVHFNAGHLTSGVYLYRLTAVNSQGERQVFTRKLTLIK